MSDHNETPDLVFPESLFAWGNSGQYSICRGSDGTTGWQKPPLRTRLISQLEKLAADINAGAQDSSVSIILVGGPGNGKTHAARHFLQTLLGDTYNTLSPIDNGAATYGISTHEHLSCIRFVEDASAGDDNESAYKRFIADVQKYVIGSETNTLFLCCVNRGILATVLARINKKQLQASEEARQFIARLSSVVSPDSTPVALWPFAEDEKVFIHPMDEESLLEPIGEAQPVAIEILKELCAADCSNCGTCENAKLCPLLHNLQALQDQGRQQNLLKILRYYEIVASKRLSFRDLFSIFSILIVGNPYDYVQNSKKTRPCTWIAKQADLTNSNKAADRLVALFELESALYHNRLFANWSDFKKVDRQLQKNIRDCHFPAIADTQELFRSLAARIRRSANLSAQDYLQKCATFLDPALQDCTQLDDLPLETIAEIKKVEDAFCKSLALGVNTFMAISCRGKDDIEERFFAECMNVEQNPSILDMSVSDPDYGLSQTVISALRILLTRMAKRSVGAYSGFVYLGSRLSDFRALLSGNASTANYAVKRRKICSTIQTHLFPGGEFEHSMLSTFGQSEPDAENAFFIKNSTTPQFSIVNSNASLNPVRNLIFVTEPSLGLTIKVNFDLYSALIDLQSGLTSASLPERIADIFDGVKARIQGRLCHNWNGATSFVFQDRNRKTRIVKWSAEEGFYEDEV